MLSSQMCVWPTRRALLRAAPFASLLFTDLPVSAASDFWNKKDSADWTEEESGQLKTKSPWAKKVHAEVLGGAGARGGGSSSADSMDAAGSKGTFGGMSGADSNGISAGGGGGRGGGGRGGGGREGGGAGSSPAGPEVIVRWENAKPILEATKLQLPADLADHYVISVTGLPSQMLARLLAGVQPQPDPAARQQAMIDRLLQSASLSAKGRDPQSADLVRQAYGNQTLIFGFPRQSLLLEATDKDVQFLMKLGALTVKARFEPKEMMYKGALAV